MDSEGVVDIEDLESDSFTASGQRVYARPTSIHHWQLRDLISADQDDEAAFFCCHEAAVLRHDSVAGRSATVAALDFAPNSMTVGAGFLAAGGLAGQLEVRHLARRATCFHGAVCGSVVNSVHIARQDGCPLLFVCSNDSAIKVFSLPQVERVTTVRCPCPINYTALSPDGRFLAAVGDCEPTLLYAATPAGWELQASFTEAADVGMCCAWSTHGALFASCHQDGAVAVWDARSGRAVARLQCGTAARCLKFSPGPFDLLAVSEHEDRVTLLDARDWQRKQELELGHAPSPASSPGARPVDISGLAFTASGLRLWVGTEESCSSFDINSLKRRTFGAASMV